MSGLAVTCRGLVYLYRHEGYQVVALSGVDIDIAPGESVALLGPSGAGKSTLLAVLAGLLPPAAGQVRVGEVDLARAGPAQRQQLRARDVGVVLQGAERNLLPYLSAAQNVRFAGAADPAEALAVVGLADRRTALPAQLTPAQRQRLALAVALANRPGLLLVDEPTGRLDRAGREEVVALLASLPGTVVVVTHDPAVGAAIGRTITIRDGRVGAEGRRGEEYAVVGRDGTVVLPPEVLPALPPGTLVRAEPQPDGTVLLRPGPGATVRP